MIQSANDRKSISKEMQNLKNASLFEDTSKNNVFIPSNTSIQNTKAEDVYSELIQLGSEEIPADPTGLINPNAKAEHLARMEKIVKLKTELVNLNRKDLLDSFDAYLAQLDKDRKKKENEVFENAINEIIDLDKVSPEIIPYLINVEKRLTALEQHQKVGF